MFISNSAKETHVDVGSFMYECAIILTGYLHKEVFVYSSNLECS